MTNVKIFFCEEKGISLFQQKNIFLSNQMIKRSIHPDSKQSDVCLVFLKKMDIGKKLINKVGNNILLLLAWFICFVYENMIVQYNLTENPCNKIKVYYLNSINVFLNDYNPVFTSVLMTPTLQAISFHRMYKLNIFKPAQLGLIG